MVSRDQPISPRYTPCILISRIGSALPHRVNSQQTNSVDHVVYSRSHAFHDGNQTLRRKNPSTKQGCQKNENGILKWEPVPLHPNPKIAEIDWGRSRFRSRKKMKNTRGKGYPNCWRQFQRQKYIFFPCRRIGAKETNLSFSSKKNQFFPRSKAASTPIYFCNFRVRTLGDWFSFQNPFSCFWQPCWEGGGDSQPAVP